uniref:Uncharacterized protein n=1 Tax=Monopterus albus TaxID=43700 RepID=A0A3Q3J9T7_MONAL
MFSGMGTNYTLTFSAEELLTCLLPDYPVSRDSSPHHTLPLSSEVETFFTLPACLHLQFPTSCLLHLQCHATCLLQPQHPVACLLHLQCHATCLLQPQHPAACLFHLQCHATCLLQPQHPAACLFHPEPALPQSHPVPAWPLFSFFHPPKNVGPTNKTRFSPELKTIIINLCTHSNKSSIYCELSLSHTRSLSRTFTSSPQLCYCTIEACCLSLSLSLSLSTVPESATLSDLTTITDAYTLILMWDHPGLV